MKLYSYYRSSASWRVRIALGVKGLTYEYVPVHLLNDGGEQNRDAYHALNPMRQVPTLEFSDNGETRWLSQSLAIIDYLEALVPEPPLLPTNPYLRARALQLAEVVNAGIQPLQNVAVTEELKRLGVDTGPWLKRFIGTGLTALEALAGETAGAFLVGDSITIADVCLIPQLATARRFGVDPAAFPILSSVEKVCAALPVFQRAHADAQPDTPK